MSILDLFKVDLDTPQPGGRQGESPRSAFTKYNDALDAIAQLVNITSVTEPSPTVPLMTWLDTSVTPPMIRRRNEANTDWVTIGPALTPFGTAATLDAIGTAPLYGRDSILGTVSQSGGVPTGAIIESGSNANGEYVKFASGDLVCKGGFLLDHAASLRLEGETGFPHAFSGSPDSIVTNIRGIAGGTSWFARSGPYARARSGTSFSAQQWAILGESFTTDSTAIIEYIAIGRWY